MCTGQPSEARGGVGSWTSSQGGPGHAIHMESRRLTVLIRFLCTPRIQTCQYWALLFKVHSHIKYSTIFSLPLHLSIAWWIKQKRISLQCRRRGFDPWVRKIPWRREWKAIPVILPGELHGQRRLVGSMGSQRVGHNWMTD